MTEKREGLTMNQLAENNALLTTENRKLQEQVKALASENVALRNSSGYVLQDGEPPNEFYRNEWFIARLKTGEFAALKALPEEYSHDYRTVDQTYYTKDWVTGWMQLPVTEYLPNVKTPATDAFVADIRNVAIDDAIQAMVTSGAQLFGDCVVAVSQLRKQGGE